MSLIVNRLDLDFLLYEFLKVESLFDKERFQDYDREAVDAIINSAEKLAEEKYYPFAAKLDANEPQFIDGEAIVIPEVKEAINAYAEAGLFAAGFDHELGGMQMPEVIRSAMNGMFACANLSVSSYVMLTTAAANLIAKFGSEQQRNRFLQPMLAGDWFGTMCLSEPQAGSSLSDIRTKAEATNEGHYLITGTKMWISGGEQNISDNIVHMVLAKIPGGPAGVKGISLFIVPKYRVDEMGGLGEKNNIALAGLNHKMGHRGTTNTLLNFGEAGDTYGYLVGEANKGLLYMFHMMNEARIAVGYGAVMSGLAGYLYSLDYARNRLQGRHPQEKNPHSKQIPIIQHADVRRMLLKQKAFVEGGLALALYSAHLLDLKSTAKDKQEKQRLELLLEIITPITKSWPSEFCLEANKLAIQILGGYGYTRDYPVERFYRDNRLNHIHEGTHAIQGLDLLGRKVQMMDGLALKVLCSEIMQTIEKAKQLSELEIEALALTEALSVMKETTNKVVECEDVKQSLANATLYIDSFGHIVIAWIWLAQAIAALEGLRETKEAKDFYKGKLATMQYFFRYELPSALTNLKIVASLDDTCLLAEEEFFVGQ